MKTVTVEGRVVTVTDGNTVWTLQPGQVDKHRPMFGADIDALPKADRDKVATLEAEAVLKATR